MWLLHSIVNAANPVNPPSADRKTTAFDAICYPFQSASSTQHLHQKGGRVSSACTDSAQIDPNHSSANIVLSNAPKCGQREKTLSVRWWHAGNLQLKKIIAADCFEGSIFKTGPPPAGFSTLVVVQPISRSLSFCSAPRRLFRRFWFSIAIKHTFDPEDGALTPPFRRPAFYSVTRFFHNRTAWSS